MNTWYARDGENPGYQQKQADTWAPGGENRSQGPNAMDEEVVSLFARFNLGGQSKLIADSLGVCEANDFNDIHEAHIVDVCKSLGLKPVQETKLRRLVKFVQTGEDMRSPHKSGLPLSADSSFSQENEPPDMYGTRRQSEVFPHIPVHASVRRR